MKKTDTALPLRLAKWVLTAATLLVAALLIAQCTGIYLEGVSPENIAENGVRIRDIYSREIVAERFAEIAFAVVFWLIAFAAVLALQAIRPCQAPARPPMPVENRLALMKKRLTQTPAMEAEERRRRRAGALCAAVCAACSIAVVAYIANPAHFASRDTERAVGALLLYAAPFVVTGFSALMIFGQWRQRSLIKEIALSKEAKKRAPEPENAEKRGPAPFVRIALFAAALTLLIAGVLNGGMRDVLMKAVKICSECIGLG